MVLLQRVFLFLITFYFGSVHAADSLSISHLTIRQGLSNNSIRCIYQDHNGFMWFGTYDGLNRYDGYSFKAFRNQVNDMASIPHNYVNAIGEDKQNNIWVGTGQGMSIYNSLTGKFRDAQYLPYGQKQKQRIPFNINAIKTDAKGNLYIAADGGGLLLQAVGTEVPVQLACPLDTNGTCRNNVQNMVVDRNDNVWLFIGDAGLYRYNVTTRQVVLVNAQLNAISAMEFDGQGNLWLGGYGGLRKYDTASHTITQVYNEAPGQLTANTVFSIKYDGDKSLWIGTESGGIDILNLATQQFTYLLPGEGENELSSKQVLAIYQDGESRKWIGTFKGGINIIDPNGSRFTTIEHNPFNANSLVNNFISSFYEAGDGNVWIGTDGGGVSVWNRSRNSFTNYQHVPGNAGSLSFNSVPSIVEDYLGNIWVGTFGNGINKFNKATGTFEHYPCYNPAINLENNYVWRLYEDQEHNLWATTYANGRLYKLNRQTNRFEVFSSEFADMLALLQDSKGTLWAGTVYGLVQIDQQKKSYTTYPIYKPVRAIFEDSKKQLWVGTEGGGLVLFDCTTKKITVQYTTKDGLCNNSVLNILEDNQGCLWLSTFSGLSRFNPANKSFKNFYGEDGLQSNQFEYNAALRLRSGEMLFGGINGFNIFNPARLPLRNFNPPVLLTDLRINNEDVAEGSPYITAVTGDKIEAVKIPFNEAVLSFDFATLEYSAPGKINYAYYLEGWDKNWNYTTSIRTANYTNLREGTYTLRIKATNAEGTWNPKEVRLKVVVLPPWYRSWWAYLLYAAIVTVLIYLYNAYRVRKAHLETEVKLAQLQSEKDKEFAQLEIQKEKELAEKKLTFFTDVSHEFRTPLTLIINPLKDYLQSEKQQDRKELNVVYRNARRLLTLVDQLLQFRKAGEDADTLRIVKLNFSDLCREVFASFENAAKRKNLTYQFTVTNDFLELYADREKMEVILYNLLSNALKFTPDGGEIVMTILENESRVGVKLADNGRGIPPEVGNKLFERFYRVQETQAASKPGFGIGLYLVKHFVEKHRGKISYESTPGTGTTFSLSFEKGNAHLIGLPIYEDVVEKSPLPEIVSANTKAPEPEKNGLEELVSSQKTILIVEDNDQIREYVVSIFKDSFIVYQASGGNQGVELAKTYLPDIIISDIMMDQGNGIELCSTIKNDASLGHIPVILLTAVSDKDIRLKGTESGADDYITKPFEKELLVARVTALLKNRTKLQEYFYNEVTFRQQDFKITSEYKEFLDRCIAIVESHLEDDAFNIKKLSQEIGMSHSALFRKVKSISGQSIAGFIRFIRLRKAAELMIKTTDNVNEIAFQVGLNDVKYFRKQFNALFGMNPSEYIKKFRAPFTNTLTVKGKLGNTDNE